MHSRLWGLFLSFVSFAAMGYVARPARQYESKHGAATMRPLAHRLAVVGALFGLATAWPF